MTKLSILKNSKEFTDPIIDDPEKLSLDSAEFNAELDVYFNLFKIGTNHKFLNQINLTKIEQLLQIILSENATILASHTKNFYPGDKILEINDRKFVYENAKNEDEIINYSLTPSSGIYKVTISPIEEQKRQHLK